LNEEAGKLYLEDYPAYCSQARLFTEVHAKRSTAVTSLAPDAMATTTAKQVPESSISNATALQNSQAQNKDTLPSEPTKPKMLVFGLGMVQNEEENGENRPAKKRNTKPRAGKGALKRL